MPMSTYDGINGVQPRGPLAGLNLTTDPKVLIECGNMRNADRRRDVWCRLPSRQAAAAAMTLAITVYLTGHPVTYVRGSASH